MHGIPKSGAYPEELPSILDGCKADVMFVGHTHVSFIKKLGDGRVIMNPGALLRDPGPGCNVYTPETFGEVDLLQRRFTIHKASIFAT
jgi:predicted phosphodiesterase